MLSNMHVDIETLYRDFFTPLFRFVFFRTQDYDVANDITQTSFLKFLERKDTPTDSVHAQKLLFTIARTTLIDYWRLAHTRKSESLSEGDNVIGTLKNPEELMQTEQDKLFVRDVLSGLSDIESDVVSLRLSGEVGYESIAETLDISVDNVRQIYSRALKKVGKVLRESGRF